jgi:hypothetical protein
MGKTTIPEIPPPRPTADELFRRSITPPKDRATPILGWAITIATVALVLAPLVWWAS